MECLEELKLERQKEMEDCDEEVEDDGEELKAVVERELIGSKELEAGGDGIDELEDKGFGSPKLVAGVDEFEVEDIGSADGDLLSREDDDISDNYKGEKKYIIGMCTLIISPLFGRFFISMEG